MPAFRASSFPLGDFSQIGALANGVFVFSESNVLLTLTFSRGPLEEVEMASNGATNSEAPVDATNAVLKPSDPVPEGAIPVEGVEFDKFTGRDIMVAELVDGMSNMGFQASSIGQAVEIVDGMVGTYLMIVVILRY